MVWKKRSDPRIKLADEWSRAFDLESLGPTREEFSKITSWFPRFEFDLFASEENDLQNDVSVRNSLPLFFLRHVLPGTPLH